MAQFRRSPAKFVLILAAALAWAVFTGEGRAGSPVEKPEEYLSITDSSGYVEARDAAGRSLALIERGAQVPPGFPPSRVLKRPVRRIVLAGGPFEANLLEVLGLSEAIVGVSMAREEWRIEEIRQGFDGGRIIFVGEPGTLDYERLKILNPDLVIASNPAAVAMLEELGLTAIMTYTSQDNSLATRFKVVDFLAAFGNQEEQAALWRQRVLEAIEDVKARTAGLKPPKVMWGLVHQKRVFVEPGRNWLVELIALANGDYLFDDVPGDSTIEVSLEPFVQGGREADILFIYPTAFLAGISKEEMIRHHFYLREFKSLSAEGRVLAAKPLFYQSAGRLDEIVLEIAAILHPAVYPDYQLKFFDEIK